MPADIHVGGGPRVETPGPEEAAHAPPPDLNKMFTDHYFGDSTIASAPKDAPPETAPAPRGFGDAHLESLRSQIADRKISVADKEKLLAHASAEAVRANETAKAEHENKKSNLGYRMMNALRNLVGSAEGSTAKKAAAQKYLDGISQLQTNLQDERQRNAADLYANGGDWQEHLKNGGDINALGQNGQTIFNVATQRQDQDTLNALSSTGARAATPDEQLAHHRAKLAAEVARQSPGWDAKIKNAGGINAVDAEGKTLLDRAIAEENIPFRSYLLEKGAKTKQALDREQRAKQETATPPTTPRTAGSTKETQRFSIPETEQAFSALQERVTNLKLGIKNETREYPEEDMTALDLKLASLRRQIDKSRDLPPEQRKQAGLSIMQQIAMLRGQIPELK